MIIVCLYGENVNGMIRTEEVGNMASASSVNGDVRKKLVELQQKLAATTDVVMDGRDIGTVVLPDADLKIFLTASPEARAQRRWKELGEKGIDEPYEKVLAEIVERDRQDTTRAAAPLRQAEDAVAVDTTEYDLEESLDLLLKLVKETLT